MNRTTAALLRLNSDPVLRRRMDFSVGLALMLLALSVYLYFFHNRFLPITEGWFQYYSSLILSGKVPYRDFQLFVPPWWPLQLTAVNALFGPEFINGRIMGAIERIVLAGFLYFWLTRFFRPTVAFISATACVFFLGACNVDLVYSYWQTRLLFGVVTGVLVSLALSAPHGRRQLGYLFVAGLCAGLAFMTKQSAVMFLLLPAFFMLALTMRRFQSAAEIRLSSVLTFVAGWLLVVLVAAFWLATSRALGPFVRQVLTGVSSKGSLSSIMFGYLGRSLPRDCVVWFLRVALLGLPLVGLRGRGERVLRWHGWPQSESGRTLLLGVAITAVVVILYLNAPLSKFVSDVYASRVRGVLLNNVFYLSAGLAVVYIALLFQVSPSQRNVQLSLLALFSLGVVVELGAVGGIDEGAVMPSAALALACILTGVGNSLYGRVLRMAAYTSAVLLIAFSVSFKYVRPYWWWGENEPDIRSAKVITEAPLLRGLLVSPNTEAMVRGIEDTIEANSLPSDYVFTFPSIPIFYLLSHRHPPTFAPVHFWDVCPDSRAVADAGLLLKNPPAVIVYMMFPERTQRHLEVSFRNGRPAGQRVIIEAIDELVKTYDYRLAGVYQNPGGYPIQVWVRPVARGQHEGS